MEDLYEILRRFGLKDNMDTIEKINSGHINQTYRVTVNDKKFILQKLNPSLTDRPEKIMSNIELVCNHTDDSIKFLTCDGRNFQSYNGAVWRVYEFVPNSVSYETLDDEGLICGFGKILGRFHRNTASIDPVDLYITIVDFHNTRKRIEKLLALDKLPSEQSCIFEKFIVFTERLGHRDLPLRSVHNDVKCSNVLFDKTNGKALALIDLDTVMPGYCVYDIGDGIRSACVYDDSIDISKLKAFCRGYFSESIDAPAAEEIFLGLICVTSELSARYLYDGYSGENYFADKTCEQKISRGEQLLRLAVNISEKEKEIISAIEDSVKE